MSWEQVKRDFLAGRRASDSPKATFMVSPEQAQIALSGAAIDELADMLSWLQSQCPSLGPAAAKRVTDVVNASFFSSIAPDFINEFLGRSDKGDVTIFATHGWTAGGDRHFTMWLTGPGKVLAQLMEDTSLLAIPLYQGRDGQWAVSRATFGLIHDANRRGALNLSGHMEGAMGTVTFVKSDVALPNVGGR